MSDVEVQTGKEAAQDNQAITKKLNTSIDKATTEAAKVREAQTKDLPADAGPKSFKESFNVTDATLGQNDTHGELVKEAQAQSLGLDKDGKDVVTVTPTPSQNQNNLKHPESQDFTDPMRAQNYLGQPI